MNDRRRAINELLFQLNSKEVKEHHDPIQLSVTDAEKILVLLKEQEDCCWISVKDKLPVRNTNVLWWCVLRDRYMGHVRIGFYDGTTNHDTPDVSCCGPNCIPLYWMPMPNAPTEATIDASGNWCCADGGRKNSDA